jgi:hypothetical protein
MKKLNVVRGVVFLTILLASADVAEPAKMVHRPPFGRHAKCERCGETGPTVPIAPVVFRVRPAVGFGVPQGPGNANLGAAVRDARPNSTLPERDEFGLDSARPAVGVAVTR